MFAALLLQQRSATTFATRERLEALAKPFCRISPPSLLVDKWFERLGQAGVTFTIKPNHEIRLVSLKWFLGGLMVTGIILLIAQLMMFGPTPEELESVRILSKASLVNSGVIFIATVLTVLLSGAQGAIIELAMPKDVLSRTEGE
jgi:hypothetical protein